jgi:hypothetical protein
MHGVRSTSQAGSEKPGVARCRAMVTRWCLIPMPILVGARLVARLEEKQQHQHLGSGERGHKRGGSRLRHQARGLWRPGVGTSSQIWPVPAPGRRGLNFAPLS